MSGRKAPPPPFAEQADSKYNVPLAKYPKPPTLPDGFPRQQWTFAPVWTAKYFEGRVTDFEIGVAAKKASLAWSAAQQSGEWDGAEDPRWFMLAVVDRAQEWLVLSPLSHLCVRD